MRAVVRLVQTLTLALVLVGAAAWQPAQAQNVVPTQYIAKLYTEAIGVAPNREGLEFFSNRFATLECNQHSLRQLAFEFFDSDAFRDPYAEDGGYTGPRFYDRPATLLTVFRALLNREPDLPTFTSYLNSGASILDIVHFITTSDEFVLTTIPAICGINPNYGFGTTPPIPLPVTGPGFVGDRTGLQNLIDLSPGSSTITLAQKALIVLDGPLYIPPGFTVTTQGQPGLLRYALMARLVRGPNFPRSQPTVILGENAALTNVWVDGQRVNGVNTGASNVDVLTLSGSNTVVADNRLSNAAGNSAVNLAGSRQTVTFDDGLSIRTAALCTGTFVRGNLITGYAGVPTAIANECEHAVIENNQIVDMGSRGIRSFPAARVPQASQVRNNLVVSAGRSAFFGILADPGSPNIGVTPEDFTGFSVSGNSIATGSRSGFAFGLGLGNRVFNANPDQGIGGSFTGNTLSGFFNVGIAVSGFQNVVVQNNGLANVRRARITRACPLAPIAVGPPAVSSGTIQPPPAAPLPDLCQ